MKILSCFSIIILLAACGLTDGDDNNPDIPGKIVFSAEAGGTYQIFIMNADGSNINQLTHFDKKFGAYSASWSPDGSKIVFSASKPRTSLGNSLYIMNADGSDMHPMNDIPDVPVHTTGSSPQWSPDGSKILFYRCVDCSVGTNHEIFIYEFKTDSVVQITETNYGVSNFNPIWSPDGRKIAFASNRDYNSKDTLRFRKDLYIIDADGTNLQRITFTGNATKPAWSPNGDKIAYTWNIDGNEVFIYSFETGEITKLETGLKYAGNPLWNKQGTQLLIFGTQQNYSKSQMRLINIENSVTEILQKIMLPSNLGATDFDWHIDS